MKQCKYCQKETGLLVIGLHKNKYIVCETCYYKEDEVNDAE